MRSSCKGLPVPRQALLLARLYWSRLSKQTRAALRGAVPELAATSARQLSSFLQHLPPLLLSSIDSSLSIHHHFHQHGTCLHARESRMLRRKRNCRLSLVRAVRKRKKSKAILTSLAYPSSLLSPGIASTCTSLWRCCCTSLRPRAITTAVLPFIGQSPRIPLANTRCSQIRRIRRL